MSKKGMLVPQRSKRMSAKPPSLVELCVRTAIDNVRYLGDVGETDIHLLERILPHCTVDQLMHVENETKERDLSQVTNKLWKKYYELKFGAENTNEVLEKVKSSKQKYTWKELYEAKLKVQDLAQKESLERLRDRYKKVDEQRQSRQIQFCSKAPPEKKRFWGAGYGGGSSGFGSSVSNGKSNILKKSKIECRNSREVQNRTAAIIRNPIQRRPVVSSTPKPAISAYNPGSSQLRDSSLAHRNLKGQVTPESKPGSLKSKGSASRYTQTDREDGMRRNPSSSKGKATSLPSKNSFVTPRTTEIDWEDDMMKTLGEFV